MNQRKIQLYELSPEDFKTEILNGVRSELQDIYQKLKAQEEIKWISRQEAADKLGVSFVTLNKWNHKNILHAHKIGGKVLYKLTDVQDKLSNH
jgi:excisionase family DNA binding protein